MNHNTSNVIDAISSGDRIALSKAITLVESTLGSDQERASAMLDGILSQVKKSIRIGITGVPGVGKSTFIEAFGLHLAEMGYKLAVLSIDPSSTKNKGSILGDKTRMNQLSSHPNAYIRPSPSGNYLGGLAQKTREAILLCEAAGFDVIIVETVGVGQSETAIKDITDFVLLLMLAGGGDELQGIKRGIMEIADMLLINKVDGDNVKEGKLARKVYQQALHLFPPNENGWIVPVETVSSLDTTGIPEVWDVIRGFKDEMDANGFFEQNRSQQNLNWFDELLQLKVLNRFLTNPKSKERFQKARAQIKNGSISVNTAIQQVMNEL